MRMIIPTLTFCQNKVLCKMQCRHIWIHCYCFNFLYKEETSQESRKLPFTQQKLPLSETNTFLRKWLLYKRPNNFQQNQANSFVWAHFDLAPPNRFIRFLNGPRRTLYNRRGCSGSSRINFAPQGNWPNLINLAAILTKNWNSPRQNV